MSVITFSTHSTKLVPLWDTLYLESTYRPRHRDEERFAVGEKAELKIRQFESARKQKESNNNGEK